MKQCGSYYLISIPYSLRYFNDLRLVFHNPGVNSPMTPSVGMEGSWLTRVSEIFTTQWHPACILCVMKKGIRFPFSRNHWYSLCVFFFHLCVYFSLSGDVRASMCSSPAVTVRVCTDGRQEGQIVYCFRPSGMPAVMDGLGWGFLQPLCFLLLTSAVCEVFGSYVKPNTDKFRPKTGVSPQRNFQTIGV